MMAGHPNETSPLGLRNLPFTIHVGANDAAYDRNKIAGRVAAEAGRPACQDPDGYVHSRDASRRQGTLDGPQGRGRDSAGWPSTAAILGRNKIVWKQDDVTRGRFYWLAADPKIAATGPRSSPNATLSISTCKATKSNA